MSEANLIHLALGRRSVDVQEQDARGGLNNYQYYPGISWGLGFRASIITPYHVVAYGAAFSIVWLLGLRSDEFAGIAGALGTYIRL